MSSIHFGCKQQAIHRLLFQPNALEICLRTNDLRLPAKPWPSLKILTRKRQWR